MQDKEGKGSADGKTSAPGTFFFGRGWTTARAGGGVIHALAARSNPLSDSVPGVSSSGVGGDDEVDGGMGSVSTSSISTAGAISEDAGALSASSSSEGNSNGGSDFGEDGGQERSTGAKDNSTEGGDDEGDEAEAEEGEDKADRIRSNSSSSFDPTLGDGEDEEEGDEGERVVFELVLDTPAPAGYKK